ncbi:hypothetical protein TNCV_345561 [Trichonephila clavipes]|nr:hypothetical protein TNCV_345561 [Trichonephila clavipes]
MAGEKRGVTSVVERGDAVFDELGERKIFVVFSDFEDTGEKQGVIAVEDLGEIVFRQLGDFSNSKLGECRQFYSLEYFAVLLKIG